MGSRGRRDILYVDKINQLPSEIASLLAAASDDFRISLVTGTGSGARSIPLPIERFTLAGGMHYTGLVRSLQERLSCAWWLQFYSVEELVTIVWRAARVAELVLGDDAALEIAKRSRSPSRALSVLRTLKAGASESHRRITIQDAAAAFEDLGIDERGLDDIDRRLVAVLAAHSGAAPVGVDELAGSLAVTEDELTGERTPWLVHLGLVSLVEGTGACKLTPEGRGYARGRKERSHRTRNSGPTKPR